MGFTAHAEMETGGENRYTGFVSLGTERRSHQTVMVFNGPDGLETSIRFTEVRIGNNAIRFYSKPRGRRSRSCQTGSIEASPEFVRFIRNAHFESADLDYTVVDQRD